MICLDIEKNKKEKPLSGAVFLLVVSGEVLFCFILGDLRTFRRVFCLRF